MKNSDTDVTLHNTVCQEWKDESVVERVSNVMAHMQKPDFVLRQNGRAHLKRQGGGGVSSVNYGHSQGVRISGSNAGCTIFLGSVKGTGYPLHSPVSPSLLLLCVTVCHHISTGLLTHFEL